MKFIIEIAVLITFIFSTLYIIFSVLIKEVRDLIDYITNFKRNKKLNPDDIKGYKEYYIKHRE